MNTTALLQNPKHTALVRVQKIAVEHKTSLVVSPKYVTQMMQEFSLGDDDLDTLMVVRSDYQAGFPKMRRLLKAGLTCEQIKGLYDAREALSEVQDHKSWVVSIDLLHEVTEVFSSADYENLTDQVLLLLELVENKKRKPSFIISDAVRIARSYGLVQLETVADYMNKSTEIWDTISDDEGER